MMTQIKIKLLPVLTVLLGLGLMSGALAQRTALAGRTDTVPAIEVKNTSALQGRYIHILYAVGRRLPIEMTRFPQLDIIRAAQAVQVTGPTVNFPSITLEKLVLRGSYNMIVLISSDKPQIKWVNPDEAVRIDYTLLNIVEKPTIDQFVEQKGPEAIFTLNL